MQKKVDGLVQGKSADLFIFINAGYRLNRHPCYGDAFAAFFFAARFPVFDVL